jgi:hypothetical protein
MKIDPIIADPAAFRDDVKRRLPQRKRIVLDLTDLTSPWFYYFPPGRVPVFAE